MWAVANDWSGRFFAPAVRAPREYTDALIHADAVLQALAVKTAPSQEIHEESVVSVPYLKIIADTTTFDH